MLRNSTATEGCQLFLTKPLGVGILATAQKEDPRTQKMPGSPRELCVQLNQVGSAFPDIRGVRAVTDVTGFGLFGHLLEICRGSKPGQTRLWTGSPFPEAEKYRLQGSMPGGTLQLDSYGEHLPGLVNSNFITVAIPKPVADCWSPSEPAAIDAFLFCALSSGLQLTGFGEMKSPAAQWVSFDACKTCAGFLQRKRFDCSRNTMHNRTARALIPA